MSGNSPASRHRTLTGVAKDACCEYLDPDSLLKQVAVSHVPRPLNFGGWGYLHSNWHTNVRTRMKIDRIRVWPPENHYSDMEPVYQWEVGRRRASYASNYGNNASCGHHIDYESPCRIG